MSQFESKSIASLVTRNFGVIKTVYEDLDPDGAYDEFVEVNEEILANWPEAELKGRLDDLVMQIYCGSETRSRLNSLQYAYLLTRYAQRAAEENWNEKALMALSDACYFAGFAEGMGMGASVLRGQGRADRSVIAHNAAKEKHLKNSEPVKQYLLELLKEQSRPEKWNSIPVAVRSVENKLSDFIDTKGIDLDPYNLHRRVPRWSELDDEFRQKLGEFVNL